MNNIILLDCTLRDGGYYNSWDFDSSFIESYLVAMDALNVDYVELGLRSFEKNGYKGACAYTTENFLDNLEIPRKLKLGVMVNASELINYPGEIDEALSKLFIEAEYSSITLVRIACHVHEFVAALPAANWLKKNGYTVGFNLMQIADRDTEEIKELARFAKEYPIDVLYFADSMGSLNPEKTSKIINDFKYVWKGPLGIHTHDNMGLALANTLQAIEEGVTWVDSTVTGMGRGPGNAKTEYLAIELEGKREMQGNILPLFKMVEDIFIPMQKVYGWGTNSYYYLAGRYGIHPTFIQEMINDTRYNEEDIIGAIEHLKFEGGKKFSVNTMQSVRNFYIGEPSGSWSPYKELSGREVIILGSGPSIVKHRQAIESYIRKEKVYVIALNTQSKIDNNLIDIRTACHPVRLISDGSVHAKLKQRLVMPASMITEDINSIYKDLKILDFGLSIQEDKFEVSENHCILPNSLVLAYTLAIAASGKASRILLAGFDGYGAEDERTTEVNDTLMKYLKLKCAPPLLAVTPSQYNVKSSSIYGL